MTTSSLQDSLSQYKKENIYIRTWAEYAGELEILLEKIRTYINKKQLSIDVVVPILRGGNIPATYFAYQLDVLSILPVQYKYFFLGDTCQLREIITLKKSDVPTNNPTILLVEGNHCYGTIAHIAAKRIRKIYPNSHIIYVASNLDYNYREVVTDADITLFGNYNNACKELSSSKCRQLGISTTKELYFPWEKIDEEWATIKLKQHQYSNLEAIRKNSKLIKTFKLSQ